MRFTIVLGLFLAATQAIKVNQKETAMIQSTVFEDPATTTLAPLAWNDMQINNRIFVYLRERLAAAAVAVYPDRTKRSEINTQIATWANEHINAVKTGASSFQDALNSFREQVSSLNLQITQEDVNVSVEKSFQWINSAYARSLQSLEDPYAPEHLEKIAEAGRVAGLKIAEGLSLRDAMVEFNEVTKATQGDA